MTFIACTFKRFSIEHCMSSLNLVVPTLVYNIAFAALENKWILGWYLFKVQELSSTFYNHHMNLSWNRQCAVCCMLYMIKIVAVDLLSALYMYKTKWCSVNMQTNKIKYIEDLLTMTWTSGNRFFNATATPAIKPPPPTGMTTASTSGTSSAISSPNVPWPARMWGWS